MNIDSDRYEFVFWRLNKKVGSMKQDREKCIRHFAKSLSDDEAVAICDCLYQGGECGTLFEPKYASMVDEYLDQIEARGKEEEELKEIGDEPEGLRDDDEREQEVKDFLLDYKMKSERRGRPQTFKTFMSKDDCPVCHGGIMKQGSSSSRYCDNCGFTQRVASEKGYRASKKGELLPGRWDEELPSPGSEKKKAPKLKKSRFDTGYRPIEMVGSEDDGDIKVTAEEARLIKEKIKFRLRLAKDKRWRDWWATEDKPFFTGFDYPRLCDSCKMTLNEIADMYESGMMPDTDDPEAPNMHMYDHNMFCGGYECTRGSGREASKFAAEDIKVGDKVVMSAEWLKNVGAQTNDIAFAVGVVKDIKQVGPNEMALVDWDLFTRPSKVLMQNLHKWGRPEHFASKKKGYTGNPRRNYYAGDPRWMKAKYESRCSDCGEYIGRGEDAYYYPKIKKILCPPCGKDAEADFQTMTEYEEWSDGGRSLSRKEASGQDVINEVIAKGDALIRRLKNKAKRSGLSENFGQKELRDFGDYIWELRAKEDFFPDQIDLLTRVEDSVRNEIESIGSDDVQLISRKTADTADWITHMNDDELFKEFRTLYEALYITGVYGARDIQVLDAISSELGSRGYTIEDEDIDGKPVDKASLVRFYKGDRRMSRKKTSKGFGKAKLGITDLERSWAEEEHRQRFMEQEDERLEFEEDPLSEEEQERIDDFHGAYRGAPGAPVRKRKGEPRAPSIQMWGKKTADYTSQNGMMDGGKGFSDIPQRTSPWDDVDEVRECSGCGVVYRAEPFEYNNWDSKCRACSEMPARTAEKKIFELSGAFDEYVPSHDPFSATAGAALTSAIEHLHPKMEVYEAWLCENGCHFTAYMTERA